MNDFYSKIASTVDNVSITENGAVGYKTTSHAMLDFNFKIASYRRNLKQAAEDFKKVLNENEAYALKFLFYVRDAREGVGERDLFKTCLKVLVESSSVNVDSVIETIIKETPEFGRWDDLFVLLDTKYAGLVFAAVKKQLAEDFSNYSKNKSVSLLAKWMPSENASSKETKKLAKMFIANLGTTPRVYRQTLSTLREYLKVVEVKTCAKEWADIDYNTVPSKANIKYANAFLRNDETRRRQYLADLNRGVDKDGNVVKINSSVNTPHDVLHMYEGYPSYWRSDNVRIKAYDETIEQLWKNLKGCEGLKDTIVVRDDSGSMSSTIGGTKVSAYEVATALAIYCAEHNSDAYKNKVITFSETPRYLDFSDEQHFGSLHSKYKFLLQHSEVANTNVEAVFDLILNTAVENKCTQEEMPKQILILSDMEFDSCAETNSSRRGGVSISLMTTIARKYSAFGYKLPRLIFWNLNSRTGTIPMKENEAGVVLVSGFSQNILKLVQSGKTDPYEVLLDGLRVARYESIPLLSFGKTATSTITRTRKAPTSYKRTGKAETPDFLK